MHNVILALVLAYAILPPFLGLALALIDGWRNDR